MRNLKRALSMALAAVMVLGLMVVGASAASYSDFTDKDEIVHKDAVAMVTELGVLAGLPDGSFGGTQNIDRASFARLVCVVLNGGKEPVLGNITTTFTDTQGNWAEAYIAYCVDRGIIAGRGDGTFGPSDNVTGSEAAKMLLVALGYDCTNEGIGGATWQTTTDVLANQAGLYEDLETLNTSEPLSRDDAAQMIYNVLNAETVTYSYTYNPNGTTTVLSKTGKTMLEDKFGVVIVEGIVVANEYANLASKAEKGAALDEGKTTIQVTNYKDGQNNYGSGEDSTNETFNVSTGADVLGRTVTLYVKPSSTASTSASKATVVGSAVVSEDNVVVTKASNNTLAKIASDNDLELDGAQVLTNYANAVTYDSAKDTAGTRGVTKTLIDNDNDGVVEYVLMTTYYFGQVSKYSTKDDGSITVDVNKAWNNSNLIADDQDDVVGFEDVALDDYVLAAWIGGKLHVEKAESITGTLDAYKKGSSVTVDGTSYDVSEVDGFINGDDDIKAVYNYANISNALDNEATFYLDQNGMVVAMGNVAENAYNYAYLWAYESGNIDNDRVKVTLSDGTTGTYTLASGSSAIAGASNGSLTTTIGSESRLYTYSINSDGEIKLTTAANPGAIPTSFTKGNTKLGEGLYATNSTVFFYVSLKDDSNVIDSVSVYTGYKNAPSVESTSINTKSESAMNASETSALAVALVGTSLDKTNVSDHLFVTDIVSESSDYTTVKAILAGTDEEVEIKVDDSWTEDDVLCLYTVNSDGYYELTKFTDGKDGYTDVKDTADHVSDSTLVIDGTEYALTSSTMLIELENGDYDTATVGRLPASDDYIVAVLVDDDDLLAIIVDNGGVVTNPSASDIEDAFETLNTVTVAGTLSENVTVPAGKALVVNGTVSGSTITNNGTVKLEGADITGTVTVGGTVTLAGTTDVTGTLDLSSATVTGTGAVVNVVEGATVKYGSIDSSNVIEGAFSLTLNKNGGVDYNFTSDATLKSGLTVAEKDTLTVAKGATLDIADTTLTVNEGATANINGTLKVGESANLALTGTVNFALGSVVDTAKDLSSDITGITSSTTGAWTCTTAGTASTAEFTAPQEG